MSIFVPLSLVCTHTNPLLPHSLIALYYYHRYRSTYVVQLYHCLKSVPRENLLVLPAERLKADPLGTVARVLRFIGVDVDPAVGASAGASAGVTAPLPQVDATSAGISAAVAPDLLARTSSKAMIQA